MLLKEEWSLFHGPPSRGGIEVDDNKSAGGAVRYNVSLQIGIAHRVGHVAAMNLTSLTGNGWFDEITGITVRCEVLGRWQNVQVRHRRRLEDNQYLVCRHGKDSGSRVWGG